MSDEGRWFSWTEIGQIMRESLTFGFLTGAVVGAAITGFFWLHFGHL